MLERKLKLLASHISHMPLLFTLRDSGVAEKEGIELELDIVNLSLDQKLPRKMSDRVSCLLRGEIDFVSGLHHETYVYRAAGDKRFMYLAQTQNAWDDRLITIPEITRPEQLEGKRILTARVSCVLGNLRRALKEAGANPDKVEFIFSGGDTKHPSHVAIDMVARGEIEAANVDIPFDLQARKKGLHSIELPEIPVIHNTTIAASTDFVRQNEESTVAFLRAVVRAIHFFKTEKEKVCEILARELAPLTHLQGDDEVEYLHQQWSRLLCAKPYPHPLAVWNVYQLEVAHDPKVNVIAPWEIWDTHYLREIDDTGFIDELYGPKN
jgi:ABC-type nitrate/sulfonate/bicarbonate transport system substrate-binding protein